jgi:ATP-dependent exoDNAse (exonuclease V) alpha subunit
VKELTAIEKARLRLAAIQADAARIKQERSDAVLANKTITIPSLTSHGWQYDTSVNWNQKQMDAINAALAGKSFCLIGAAGTGKTTNEKGIIYSLLKNSLLPIIQAGKSTKYLHAGTPGVAMVSFTNMAVRQTAKHFSKDVTCVTIHKLLEFAPEYYEVTGADGLPIKKTRFVPTRDKFNPLPKELKLIVVDESSMVDCDLFQLLVDALPDPAAVQFIFLGDLNQLPPVYGGPILGKKLLELPIVELTEVYRQALLSPIIRYALQMKDGKPTPVVTKIVEDNAEHGRVVIQPWSTALKWEDALIKAQNFCKAAIKEEVFDQMQDIILCPYNVNFGVVELNLSIADYLGRMRGAVVWEVIAGFETKYLAVGDKVLVNKREAFITKIVKNGNYVGKHPTDPHIWEIDRYGGARRRKEIVTVGDEFKLQGEDYFDVDKWLDEMAVDDMVTERKHQCSHRITVKFLNDHNKMSFDPEDMDLESVELTSAGEVNEILFAWALTVHKSQGSEWRRVFFLTHKSHAKMCSRELMYTGMTRAKEYLHVICEPDRVAVAGTLTSAARKPRLKGDTLAEKLISLKERFDREAREAKKEEDDE